MKLSQYNYENEMPVCFSFIAFDKSRVKINIHLKNEGQEDKTGPVWVSVGGKRVNERVKEDVNIVIVFCLLV
jgi:hypothetical protein